MARVHSALLVLDVAGERRELQVHGVVLMPEDLWREAQRQAALGWANARALERAGWGTR